MDLPDLTLQPAAPPFQSPSFLRQWLGCCDGSPCTATKAGEWGSFCPGAGAAGGGYPAPPSSSCYKSGERAIGAPGYAYVDYKPCCSGEQPTPSHSDWGLFCGGSSPKPDTAPPVHKPAPPPAPAPKEYEHEPAPAPPPAPRGDEHEKCRPRGSTCGWSYGPSASCCGDDVCEKEDGYSGAYCAAKKQPTYEAPAPPPAPAPKCIPRGTACEAPLPTSYRVDDYSEDYFDAPAPAPAPAPARSGCCGDDVCATAAGRKGTYCVSKTSPKPACRALLEACTSAADCCDKGYFCMPEPLLGKGKYCVVTAFSSPDW
jgi:hypothetical protein